jgi:hypothetical protein
MHLLTVFQLLEIFQLCQQAIQLILDIGTQEDGLNRRRKEDNKRKDGKSGRLLGSE